MTTGGGNRPQQKPRPLQQEMVRRVDDDGFETYHPQKPRPQQQQTQEETTEKEEIIKQNKFTLLEQDD